MAESRTSKGGGEPEFPVVQAMLLADAAHNLNGKWVLVGTFDSVRRGIEPDFPFPNCVIFLSLSGFTGEFRFTLRFVSLSVLEGDSAPRQVASFEAAVNVSGDEPRLARAQFAIQITDGPPCPPAGQYDWILEAEDGTVLAQHRLEIVDDTHVEGEK